MENPDDKQNELDNTTGNEQESPVQGGNEENSELPEEEDQPLVADDDISHLDDDDLSDYDDDDLSPHDDDILHDDDTSPHYDDLSLSDDDVLHPDDVAPHVGDLSPDLDTLMQQFDDLMPQPEGFELQPDDLIPQPDDLVTPPSDPVLQPEPIAESPASVSELLSSDATETSEDKETLKEDVEDDGEDFVILDTNHTLSKRFQAALSDLFRKKLEKRNLELREKLENQKIDDKQIQQVSLDMYRAQQRLSGVHSKLDTCNRTVMETEANYRETQNQLAKTESKHSKLTSMRNQAKAEETRLVAELDKFMRHLIITQGHTEELRSKVITVEMQKNKVLSEKMRAEEKKLKQDLYVKFLTKEVEKLTDQISIYEVQAAAQTVATRAAREALAEAEMKMEMHLLGDKMLMKQWNASLMTKTRQVETSSTIQDLRAAEQQVLLLDREIYSYKKSFRQEEDKSETLGVQLEWSNLDCTTLEKLINQKQVQVEALQADYSTCLRIIHETEATLLLLAKENEKFENELSAQRKEFEKQSELRLHLEEDIMIAIQEKLAHTNAAKYYQSLTAKKTSLKHENLRQLQQMENDVFTMKLERQKVDLQVTSLEFNLQTLEKEVLKYEGLLATAEANHVAICRLIQQKQATIFNINTKINQIVANTGNEEMDPMQIKIQDVEILIEELAAKMKTIQQQWMAQQGALLTLNREIEMNNSECRMLQLGYTGMEQKKIRLDSQTKVEEQEAAELEHNEKTLRRDLMKLDSLVCKNQQLSKVLEQENTFMETDYIHKIKEAERKSIKMQMKLDETQMEKENLLNFRLTSEQQIMLWERKIRILKETRAVVKSEIHQGEIRRLKADIHCMELRILQLKRQQEQLMKESEVAVARRGNILEREEAMAQTSHKQKTRGELLRATGALQHKIKTVLKETLECEQTQSDLEQRQARVNEGLSEVKQHLTELFCINSGIEMDMLKSQVTKEMMLLYLLVLQNRNKRLLSVRQGTYKPSTSSETVETALQRQVSNLQAVWNIVKVVNEKYPQHQDSLRVVMQAMATFPLRI